MQLHKYYGLEYGHENGKSRIKIQQIVSGGICVTVRVLTQRYWPSAYLQQLHQDGVIPEYGRALIWPAGPVVTVCSGIPWSCGGCS